MRLGLALRSALGFAAFCALHGCATLTPVDGAVCGDGVVGLDEECDSPNGGDAVSGFCGKSGTEFSCLRVPDGDGNCPAGLVSSNGRCLAGSGDFGPPQTLVDGETIVSAGDFDGDGQTDLLYQSASGLSVSFFEEGTPVEPPFRFATFFAGTVWPDVDVNGDAARDLLIPNALRSGVGVFVGTGERSFDPVFQPSFEIGEESRLVSLPPAPDGGEYTFASRFLRQLGVFSVGPNGTPVLCVAEADGACTGMPLPGVTQTIMADDLQRVVVMEPLFVVPPLASPTFHLLYSLPVDDETSIPEVISVQFAGGAIPAAVELAMPLGMPAVDGSLECLESCASGDLGTACGCVPFDGMELLAIQPLDVGDASQNALVLAGAQVHSALGKHVAVFIHDPLGEMAFHPLTTYQATYEVKNGTATNMQLGDFDGQGLGDSVISVATGDEGFLTVENVIFLGEPTPSVQAGPTGIATVGDINGDGYDDVLGNDPDAVEGGSYAVFGGPTVPFVGAPLSAPGSTDRHVIADLDGNGINDVVAIGVSNDTPIAGPESGSDDDVVSSAPQSTLTVMFGQASDFPVADLTFRTAKTFAQALPLKLQLRSPGGETSDGIDDLAILLRDHQGVVSGSLVAGDPYGFLSSPYFLRQAVNSTFGKDFILATAYGLPESVPIADGRSAIAVLYVLAVADGEIALGEHGGFLTLSVDEAGELALDRPSAELSSFLPIANIVVYESSPTVKFALFGLTDEEIALRRFELEEGVVKEIDARVLTSYPEVVKGSMEGDGRIFLIEQPREAFEELGGIDVSSNPITITLTDLDDPTLSIEFTSLSGRSQWVGASRLQIGDKILDMSAMVPGATAESVIDACVAADIALPIDLTLGTLGSADLDDDGLPDALFAEPMSWAFQTTSESVCEL